MTIRDDDTLVKQPAQQEPIEEFAYKAITKRGEHFHFRTHAAARIWAGEGGKVETIKLRHLELVEQPAQQQEPVASKQTFTRAEVIRAIEAERHACSIAVWMTLMEATEPGADDKGLDGWMREAERRIKNRSSNDPEAAQQQEPVAFSQFLSDVVTAAGLLSHGKTDKSLAARISEFAFRLRTSPQPAQRKPLTDEQIDRAIAELGLNYFADAANNRAVLRELCRKAAHGIKGDA